MDVCPAFSAEFDYTFDRVVGTEFRDPPGASTLEVSVSVGAWRGWIWDINYDENYFLALELLVDFKSKGKADDDLRRLLVPLKTESPCQRLLERASKEIARVQRGLASGAREWLRYPEQSRSRNKAERQGIMLTSLAFGASEDTAKDFMVAVGRFISSDDGRVTDGISGNILNPFLKVLHSTLQLYAVCGVVPEKRGSDIAPTCNQVQVAVVRATMKGTPVGVDEDNPGGWPVEGDEVIILDAPSSGTFRIGFQDLIAEVARVLVKVDTNYVRYNPTPTVQHMTVRFARVEIQKDGLVHLALQGLGETAKGQLYLPDSYDGWYTNVN